MDQNSHNANVDKENNKSKLLNYRNRKISIAKKEEHIPNRENIEKRFLKAQFGNNNNNKM